MADKSIFGTILDGIAAIAPTVANIVVPGSGSLVNSLMRSVTGDPPDTPMDKVAAKINADPKLLVELQTKAMDHELQLKQVEAANLATVNATMRAEARSEHWPQYSWRPFNGFLYGIAVVAIYFVLPLADKPVPAVPQFIWMGWGAILGVATWHRGKAKRAAAGDKNAGLLAGAIQAIKGK